MPLYIRSHATRILICVVVALLSVTALAAVRAGASGTSATMVGGWSTDQAWFESHVGKLEIYRGFSTSLPKNWTYSGYSKRPGVVDYSFDMSADSVASRSQEIKAFVATTPKNIIMTWAHEPESRTNPDAFRAATRIVANIVHAQNRSDGGRRRYEVILLGWTLDPRSDGDAMNWWPGRDSAGKNYADIISEDVYSDPQGPNVAHGYTNGVNWRTADQMFGPIRAFASKVNARWSVSEFGYLEDSTSPTHKARAITDAVNYASAHHAVAVQYWNGVGPRADWRLLHSAPATTAFRQAVQQG